MTRPGGQAAGAATRQANAAEQLFARYRDQIYRFCMARLRSREEAEDAVQNTFMRVHMALQRGVVPEYEAAWLYKIAHNVCLSKHESTARRAQLEMPHAFDEDESFAAPEVSRDELAGLSQALEAMPHNLRQAILLREWQGLSYAEIAEAMDTSVSAVETLIFRARRHLAAALEQGVPAPKRRLAARWLDVLGLGGLLRKLRALLAGAAPAKIVAGAALVALSGGGVGLGVSLADTPPSRHADVPAAPGGAAAPVVRQVRPATVSAALRPSRRALAHRAAGMKAAAAGSGYVAPAPVLTAVAEPHTGTPPAAEQPVAASGAPTVVASVTTAAATTTAAVPSVQLPPPPTVSTPTVDVPTASVPTVDVPTVSAPTVETPTLSAPDGTSGSLGGVVGGIVTVP